MKHAKKIVAVAVLACVSAWALVQAQNAPDPFVERYSEILQPDHKPTIVNFTATWCGPCQRLKPHLATLKKKGYRVKSYDIDKHPDLFTYFHGKSVPLTCLWKDEMIQKRWVGVIDLTPHLTEDYRVKTLLAPQGVEESD